MWGSCCSIQGGFRAFACGKACPGFLGARTQQPPPPLPGATHCGELALDCLLKNLAPQGPMAKFRLSICKDVESLLFAIGTGFPIYSTEAPLRPARRPLHSGVAALPPGTSRRPLCFWLLICCFVDPDALLLNLLLPGLGAHGHWSLLWRPVPPTGCFCLLGQWRARAPPPPLHQSVTGLHGPPWLGVLGTGSG